MKIVPIFLRYNYGQKSRGDSLEYMGFYPALQKIAGEVFPFWFDDYLDKKEALQAKLISFVDEVKPDVVFFILIKDEFTFDTLAYLKSKYLTVNWFGDDNWRFDSFTRYYAPHFTYSITTDEVALRKYKKIDYLNAILSQWASFDYDKSFEPDKIEYKYDVSFVGSCSGQRQWVVDHLNKKGIKVECFGWGWPNGVISFDKMKEIFKTSRINLNLSNSVGFDPRCIFSSYRTFREFGAAIIKGNSKVGEQMKARNFEIPCFGGFQLTNRVESLGKYLKIGEEVALYKDTDELLTQIRHYLSHENARKNILIKSYRRSSEQHLYLCRLKECFKSMGL